MYTQQCISFGIYLSEIQVHLFPPSFQLVLRESLKWPFCCGFGAAVHWAALYSVSVSESTCCYLCCDRFFLCCNDVTCAV